MKKLLTFIFLLISVNFYSQDFSLLDKALKEKYPEKKSFTADGIWMYYSEVGNIKKIQLEFLSKLTPTYEYYTVNITNFLDWHVENPECVILFSKIDNSIILIPPIWFSGINEDFYKLFTDYEFKDKTEIDNFIKEMQTLILIDSGMHLGKTTFEENKIILRLILNDKNGTWRTVEFNFNGNRLINVVSNRE